MFCGDGGGGSVDIEAVLTFYQPYNFAPMELKILRLAIYYFPIFIGRKVKTTSYK
jgi:hypothetical protein